MDFVVGQRWLSETEPELGLGIVTECDVRTVTVAFRSCEENRRYARHSAPLDRIVFGEGDSIKNRQGRSFTVKAVQIHNGQAVYRIAAEPSDDSLNAAEEPTILLESDINDRLLLNRPVDRLMSGQIENYAWFALKKQTLEQLGAIEKSNVLGLCSSRTELIPHQLYIAAEVAQRYAPRVMLADEVGLGKTIEAGLILQQQMAMGLASRVLIIVPEPLLHQWLVEMLRRFNLRFSLLDKARCEAIAEEHQDNPFHDEQLILTSMSLLSKNPDIFAQACAGEWDLCIVDEAHHLQDTPSESGQSDYSRMQELAQKSNGMLLLTATPEQLGDENHFALLRLLDPHRFSSYENFCGEQQHYRNLADTINKLLENPAEQKQVQKMLDEHGTGRILFRNTRRSLSGFPERELQAWPLIAEIVAEAVTSPAQQKSVEETVIFPSEQTTTDLVATKLNSTGQSEVHSGEIFPEDWTARDPRVVWLQNFLKKNKKDKILLICAEDKTAIMLERYLRVQGGVRSSVFHRFMNIVERDRAAAYFAGSEDGARILVCSEIGSEGRNFQFCKHLVLFDLPLNPDLLEQRIGRLDRIGQKNTIQIHVPYIKDTDQEVMFRWYHEALNAFVKVAPAAWRVYREHESQLLKFVAAAGIPDFPEKEFTEFLHAVSRSAVALQLHLEQGRDRLLEINSFRPDKAQTVIAAIHQFEAQESPQRLLCNIFDNYGIHYEENSDNTWTMYPGEEMLVPSFPELPDEGFDASFLRQTALHRDDIQFLHWQHPLVRGAMDLVLDSHLGRAAASRLKARTPGIPAGASLLVECLYRISIAAPRHLQLPRYFPASSLHFLLAADALLAAGAGAPASGASFAEGARSTAGPDVDNEESATGVSVLNAANLLLTDQLEYLDKHDALRLVRAHQQELQQALEHGHKLAQLEMSKSVNMAAKSMLENQTVEIRRLVTLKQNNPNVRESELAYLKEQTMQLHECFKQASIELVAVHVMFV